ncbi:MAG: type IV pilus modification PilV family protein [Candidatus Kerfeldbacteria bacterium]
MLINRYNNKGFSVIELMIAMTVFIMVVSGIMFLVLDAQSANRQGAERTKASLISQQGIEATYSIANQGWKNLVDGTYGIDDTGMIWEWLGNSNVIDFFTRQIIIDSVYRDINGDIVETGGSIDFDSKKVTVKTIWDFTTARPSEVTVESILTNWHSTKWKYTTQIEFNQGTLNNVAITSSDDGEIVLGQSSVASFFNSPFDVPANYTYNLSDIEVSSSQASLVNQGATVTGGTINSSFDSTLNPWSYNDWDQNGGEANVDGYWDGNPDGHAHINIPSDKRDEVGGYFEQSFQVTDNNPDIGTLDFDYSIITFDSSFNPSNDSFEIFAFLDTVSGEPTPGTEIWSSGQISGISPYASVNLDISSDIAVAGTYYVKLVVWITTGTQNKGPFDVGFDEAIVYWEKTGSGGSYPTTNPTIKPTNSFASVDIDTWTGFQETAIKNGGEIYYQLSDDDGSTWQYWNGSSWAIVAGVTDYNIATVVNTNIPTFPATTQQLMFKAFLSSDGTQLVGLNNVMVEYTVIGGTGYFMTGTFESSNYDTGVIDTVYNYIDWSADIPIGTQLQWQIRTADIEVNLITATWVGSDGTGVTFYSTIGEIIEVDPLASGVRWIQCKAYLNGDSVVTPIINDITIDYED